MPFLGERHQSWVNDIKRIRLRRLSFKDRVIALLLVLLMMVVGCFEMSSYRTQNLVVPKNSWLYLTATGQNVPSPSDPNWSDERSTQGSYWIMSKISMKKDGEFDVLQVSLSESYQVFWDGYLIGSHDHLSEVSVTNLYLLEQHHVLAGHHHVMLFVQQPNNTYFDLSKKQFLIGKEEQIRIMAVTDLFLLMGALGLAGILVLIFTRDIKYLRVRPGATLWILAIISIYLGLSLVNTLHHQPFRWNDPILPAIATACSLQLVFALSRHTSNLLFKSFFSISAATYIIVYFVLVHPEERLILYLMALLLTLFFFLYTTANRRVSVLWCLAPILPILSPNEEFSFVMLAVPLTLLLGYQLFYLKTVKAITYGTLDTSAQKTINYLLVNSKSDKKSIPLDSVVCIKAANNYAIIEILSGETFLHDKSLLKLSEELPENFRRIHKSYLINFDQIEHVNNKPGGGKILHMKNGEYVPVGRVYQKALTARFA